MADSKPSQGSASAGAGSSGAREGVSIVVWGALVANLVLTVAKYIVAFITGSSALLSEAFHSTADTGNSLLLLIGVRLSARPADRIHPFGRGHEVYFWGLIVATLLFGVGGGLSIYEGVQHIRSPEPMRDPFWNYVVLGCALILEGGSLAIAVRTMQRLAREQGESFLSAAHSSKNPEHFVVLFEDAAAVLGILVAFGGVYAAHRFHAPWIDGASSLVIGLILCAAATILAYECRSLLLGESADPGKIDDIRALLDADAAVLRVGQLLTMHLGPHEILVNANLDFCDDLTVSQVRSAIARIERRVRERHPDVGRIFLEVGTRTSRQEWEA